MKTKHRVTKWGMDEPMNALIAHLDELAADGWEVFHLHEVMSGGTPSLFVFSRKKTDA